MLSTGLNQPLNGALNSRIVEVCCDKCQCHYSYRLSRYRAQYSNWQLELFYSRDQVSRWAHEGCHLLLNEDAELVPCPKCSWISDALVAAYRRNRFANVADVGHSLSSAIAIASALVAFEIARPQFGANAAIWVLSVGSVLGAVSMAATTLAPIIGRRLIRPNRDFPRPPRLPPGTPPPLLPDPVTGELRPIPLASLETAVSSPWITLRVGVQALPARCCQCLSVDCEPFCIEVGRDLNLTIYRCPGCADQPGWSRQTVKLIPTLFALGVTPIIACMFLQSALLGLGSLIVAVIGHHLLDNRSIVTSNRALEVAWIDQTRCVARVRFGNRDYQELAAATLANQP